MYNFSARKGRYALVLFGALAAISASAQTFTSLASFQFGNGAGPNGALVQGTNGNLYGTVLYGGASYNGAIFSIAPAGALVMVHAFDFLDGEQPFGPLALATNGNFYGTTIAGGPTGAGSVYKMTPRGQVTSLYGFCPDVGNCTDGAAPETGLVQGVDGNFYGTTDFGGAGNEGEGNGTLFKITPQGQLTTLHDFCPSSCGDGLGLTTPLVQGLDGNIYGVTAGAGNVNTDGGTFYRITPTGTLTTLYDFCSLSKCADGQQPTGLMLAYDGNFYGTTVLGGSTDAGTVFRMTSAGTLTTLYSFCSQAPCSDGDHPYAGLVQGTDGNFYGMTEFGGTGEVGTIFRMTPSGNLTTLHQFAGSDGAYPSAPLTQSTNGLFYGTTYNGGTSTNCHIQGCGTVFSLDVGLVPFVETLPVLGKVGSKIAILGNGLSDATAVSFNGTAASFAVISDTAMTAVVPAGATTGRVEVTTSAGTLKSNVVFHVR